MSENNWESGKMLAAYIHDYFMKRNLQETAKTFQAEANVSSDPVEIDTPGGFLFEWWSIFWDMFRSRTNDKQSDVAASDTETQLRNAREQQQQQQSAHPQQQLPYQQQPQQQNLQNQIQMQQLREDAMANMMLEEHLAFTSQMDSLIEIDQRLKSPGMSSQPAGGNLQQIQARNQQHFGALQAAMDLFLNSRAADPQRSIIGVPGLNQSCNSLTLKERPPSGHDQFRSGIFQEQKPLTYLQQLFRHLQLLDDPQQQQFLLRALRNQTSENAVDFDRNMIPGDVAPNVGSSIQPACPVFYPEHPNRHLHHKASESRSARKRKQPVFSGTAALIGFGDDGPSASTSRLNQLEDNSESLKNDATEIAITRSNDHGVVCCDFSYDGKLLATGGHDKKAYIWNTYTSNLECYLEEHSSLITDVRFCPTLRRLATSSLDKTVRVWDVENPSYPLRIFAKHSVPVMSLDFHPNKEDLVCSCDRGVEIRYWNIENGSSFRTLKSGVREVRFQPRLGRYLAAATQNMVSIIDLETEICRHSLQGHTNRVDCVCWDPSGEYLASVSVDSLRVWSLASGREGECVHELSCNGNDFHSCVFHPTRSSLMAIGRYQSLELWDMAEKKKKTTFVADEGLVSALAASGAAGVFASASRDKLIKLWKW